MNILMWLVAGGIAGWIGFKFVGANESRGLMTSIFIGMVGGFFGGNVLAPMLGESNAVQDAINVFALVMAAASAAACLTVGEMLAKRFDI